jgi:phage tail tape-measure protein
MATPVSGLCERPATSLYSESFRDVGLCFATMCGGVGGAIGGAALGAEVGSVFPVLFGTLGTMLGGALLAGGWCLLTHLWSKASSHEVQQTREQPAHASTI